MTDLCTDLLRTLAGWSPAGGPVTSLYLDVDGSRYPRKSDYEVRLDEQLRRARACAGDGDRDAARSVERDVERMSSFVREEFERGDTRGLALFSSSAEGLWEHVALPRPVRDRVVVAPQADVLPLQQLLDTYHRMCLALVDYQRARLFLMDLGRLVDEATVEDDTPNRHDQGGWAQMRMQRHVDDHRTHHVKRVADALFALHRARGFEHLVLAGPGEAHVELGKALHDYLRRRVRATLGMAMTASPEEVRRAAVALEEELERKAEAAKARELLEAAAGGRGVTGLAPTLEAVGGRRARELIVALDRHAPGAVCGACGWLSDREGRCPACSARLERIPDVVDTAVTRAVLGGSRVETVVDASLLAPADGLGALLRF